MTLAEIKSNWKAYLNDEQIEQLDREEWEVRRKAFMAKMMGPTVGRRRISRQNLRDISELRSKFGIPLGSPGNPSYA